jgi:ATP-dependent exoDNAse (exonuclease V) beta subunit
MLTGDATAHLLPIADALRALQRLHRERNYRPVADTISRLLTETRAHVGLILRPAGEQALANVLHVAELARQYELGGGISFRGFIDELRAAVETETAEAPILEETSDGVRLMTVHKAKGLEFPVVILADLTCRLSRSDASRYVDVGRRLSALRIGGWAPHDLHDHETVEVARDQAEGVRLAYVAATRARDLLVVPAVGDSAWEGGWFSPLNRALYPPVTTRRTAVSGPKVPAFKSKDSVLERPNDEIASTSTVCPGQHVFNDVSGAYAVVWWDPGALALGAKPSFGVRRGELVMKDVPRHVVAEGRSRYDRWCLARADARTNGAAPSLVVATVRQWAAENRSPESLVTNPMSVAVVDVAEGRRSHAAASSSGAAFGALVHAVLAQAPFEATRADLENLVTAEARVIGLGRPDVEAAVDTVACVLRHELLTRARAAAARGVCRRETPVSCVLPNGMLVEGVVDLAFEEGGRWTVVDYKTDRELAATGEEQYRRQVALYAQAVAQATGGQTAGVLVRV